jgi:hypothetical protein
VLLGGVSVEEAPAEELSLVELVSDEASVDEGVADALSLEGGLADGLALEEALLLADEMALEDALLDELSLGETMPPRKSLLDEGSVAEDDPELVLDVGSGGETTTVLEMMIVVTLVSLDEAEFELVSDVVVSEDELGKRLSGNDIVALTNCRFTWRGK